MICWPLEQFQVLCPGRCTWNHFQQPLALMKVAGRCWAKPANMAAAGGDPPSLEERTRHQVWPGQGHPHHRIRSSIVAHHHEHDQASRA